MLEPTLREISRRARESQARADARRAGEYRALDRACYTAAIAAQIIVVGLVLMDAVGIL